MRVITKGRVEVAQHNRNERGLNLQMWSKKLFGLD